MNEQLAIPAGKLVAQHWVYKASTSLTLYDDVETNYVAECEGLDLPTTQAEQVARRLAACWNACAGISTENLEDNEPVKLLAEKYDRALVQRDELLAALVACTTDEGPEQEELNRARSAIAKATASQPATPDQTYP